MRIPQGTAADLHLDEAAIKSRLDAIAYPFQFFREYDEPNESFAPRLVCDLPALQALVATLPIWPNVVVQQA